MSLQPFAPPSSSGLFPLLAATPAAGFTLINGTPTIVSFTFPNDGKLHQVMLFAGMDVTSAATGGQVVASFNLPDGTTQAKTLFAAGQGIGQYAPLVASYPWQLAPVQAGSTFSVFQNSPLTVGAAIVWAMLYGS